MAATMAPHQPPKSRALAKCMMKEVDPFAPSLRGVLRLSSKVATKRNVARGHQPGKGRRTVWTAAPESAAAVATAPTNRVSRLSRDIAEGTGIPILLKNLAPGSAFPEETCDKTQPTGY